MHRLRDVPLRLSRAEGNLKEPNLAVSIVIITKDTKDLLRDLLSSIDKDVPLKPLLNEIVVVDNASSDGTDAMVAKDFPAVLLLRNEKNRGFAASANAGFHRSTGDFIFLLNSDTLLLPGEAVKMARFMEANTDVGICGPQLVYPDMKLQRSSASIPSLLAEIMPSLKTQATGKRVSRLNTALDVPSLIGAAIMMRRAALERVNGFDERFFFFLEETDLCMRIRSAGFRVILFTDAKVIHLQGRTVRKNWVKGRIEYNISMYKFIRKHHGLPYYRFFQMTRVTKAALLLCLVTTLPFLLIGSRTRRTYVYYANLVGWHLKGCPDTGGLRPDLKG